MGRVFGLGQEAGVRSGMVRWRAGLGRVDWRLGAGGSSGVGMLGRAREGGVRMGGCGGFIGRGQRGRAGLWGRNIVHTKEDLRS